ncbi:MAG: class I SAM-dependent methyltransferase [bacterium]|nr:class I SAM-dependent methyltransferase [bacterium]
MDFENVYQDAQRAEAYARLEFPGTYYLAYRDLPTLFATHVSGKRALDFGCGTGRSTRFLKGLGFETIGVDISADMLKLAQTKDRSGKYLLVNDSPLELLAGYHFDLILAAFTFDNVPTLEKKFNLFTQLASILADDGRIINLVSAPEIYTHEWASFTTKEFPENRFAKLGDRVKIVMTDVEDRRPVEDVLWTDEGYRDIYEQASLEVIDLHQPLAHETEPFKWVNETRLSPWSIYVLGKV